MVLSIPEAQVIDVKSDDDLEVVPSCMVEIARFSFRSWGQKLTNRPAPEGEVVVCLTLDLGFQTQVHVTCPLAAAEDLLDHKLRQFKVRLVADGLAITRVASRHYPNGYIDCRRDA